MMLVATTEIYWVMLPCVFVTGAAMMLMLASGNTVIQHLVKNEMRGRVMSLFNFSLLGIVPFGSLLTGAIAQRIGVTSTLYLNGVICLAGSFVFLQHGAKMNRHISEMSDR
jgi:predicted MFS family arabinose efflux permease